MIRSGLEWSLWRLSWTGVGADQTGGEGELEAHEAKTEAEGCPSLG